MAALHIPYMAGVAEYLLVMAPPEHVRSKIISVRETFREKFSYEMPLRRPHITLLRFYQREQAEKKFVNRLAQTARIRQPIRMELNGFGSFPSHSIYIRADGGHHYTDMVKSFREWQHLMKAVPDKDPHFMLTPFIHIAYKLLPWQYEKGWNEYQHKHFSARFIADQLLLLKKREGEKAYQIVQGMQLEGAPVAVKQAVLF